MFCFLIDINSTQCLDPQHFGLLNPDPLKYADPRIGIQGAKYLQKTVQKKIVALKTLIRNVEKRETIKNFFISEWFLSSFSITITKYRRKIIWNFFFFVKEISKKRSEETPIANDLYPDPCLIQEKWILSRSSDSTHELWNRQSFKIFVENERMSNIFS